MAATLSLKKPKAVFFDWDGTLVDSYAFLNDAHGYTLRKLGLPPFAEGEYREYFGRPREVLYPLIYKDKSEEAKEVFGKYVVENSHNIPRMKGADEFLETLSGMGVVMGVVSNKRADYIRREIGHFGWERYFHVVIGGGDAQKDKPSSAPLRLALEKAGVKENQQGIWFVGDTDNDLACAAEFGCISIFIEGHKDSEAFMRQYKPHISVADCAALRKILVAL